MQPSRASGILRRRRSVLAAVLALGLVATAAACGGDDDDKADGKLDTGLEEIKAVPSEYKTIQKAVDASKPGDLILISPGLYKESVTVTAKHSDIVIRGLDRNTVILDGEFKKDNGIRVLEADGVAIENMTARNYTTNGFYWISSERYRGSYLTAHNNGDYGIYAFDSTVGLFENSYGSGSPDAGFYIGQCYPCDAVIRDSIAENNGLGYSGTNAGGNLFIINSTFRQNRAGIVPNSGSYEKYPPERETTVAGNLVYSNNNYETPAINAAILAEGNGILIAGGNDNVIVRNRVWDHDIAGVVIVISPDDKAEGGAYWPSGNKTTENVVSDSRMADLAMFEKEGAKNCFADNEYETTAPSDLETLAPCEGVGTGDPAKGALDLAALATTEGKPPSGDYKDVPAPKKQPNMPDADSAPWEKAGAPPKVDLAAIEVPEKP